jgi:elongation factor P
MINTGDFKKGTRFEFEGEPFQVLEVTSQSPSARGGATLVKTKLRNLLTGGFTSKAFKSGDRFPEPDLEKRDAQYLYKDDDLYYFMDLISYDTLEIGHAEVGDASEYLIAELEVKIMTYNERSIAVEVPASMDLQITDCEPAVRGDTVNAVTKAATLETGLVLQVPMFVENGERVRVDTRDGRYMSRAK